MVNWIWLVGWLSHSLIRIPTAHNYGCYYTPMNECTVDVLWHGELEGINLFWIRTELPSDNERDVLL